MEQSRAGRNRFIGRDASRSRRLFHGRNLINDYARGLMDAHGDRAIAEAAQRAATCERLDDKDEAKTWRQVEAALKTMQGPIAS